MTVTLEHANITVSDPEATAAWMCELFGWEVRWSGDSIHSGRSVHVGTDTQYLALYSPGTPTRPSDDNYQTVGGLNHIAVVVDDIAHMEKRVANAGFKPTNHADYEPGQRFYFHDNDNVEFEVVQYD